MKKVQKELLSDNRIGYKDFIIICIEFYKLILPKVIITCCSLALVGLIINKLVK